MTEKIVYRDGDIVWVKMNKLWWPGEVHGSHRLPSDFFEQFKKPPLVVVKFFQEHNYHYVNQLNQIAQFNCAKKSEFIKKGLDLYYAKHQCMEEFPADVAIAEKRTGGNPNIIYSKEFMPATKPEDTKMQGSTSKGTTSRSRRGQNPSSAPIAIPRVMIKPDHHPRILAAAASSPSTTVTAYKCTSCNFGTNRMNTFVWHQKSHSTLQKTPQPTSTNRRLTFVENTIDTDAANSDATTTACVTEEHIDLDDSITDPIPTESTKKSSNKRQRQTVKSSSKSTEKTPSKSTEKTPKTENKLKKILEDWSDEEVQDDVDMSGPTPTEGANVIILDTDDEDDVTTPRESSAKRLKRSEDKNSGNAENGVSNVMGQNDIAGATEVEHVKKKMKRGEDVGQKTPSEDVIPSEDVQMIGEEKSENKPRLVETNTGDDESTPRQSGRLQTKNADNVETPTPTRSHLRSGRVLDQQKSKLASTPKRRGRSAKLIADDCSVKDSASENVQIFDDQNKNNEVESEPSLLSQDATDNENSSPPENKTAEGILATTPVGDQKKKINSRTSRKGKPRRKEEIKLANNLSVAVLVEKTTASPLTVKRNDQKLDERADVDEYTNVVHKKIRYLSHSSSDDYRKSIETPKHREQETEVDNAGDDQAKIEIVHDSQNDQLEIISEKTVEMDHNDIESVSDRQDGITSQDAEEFSEKRDIKTNAGNSIEEPNFTENCRQTESMPNNESNDLTVSTISLAEETKTEEYNLQSHSNLRQRAPKRYGNARSLRKSERRKDVNSTSMDDFADIVNEINQKCEEVDRMRQKPADIDGSFADDAANIPNLNDSVTDVTHSSNSLDQSSETSNSKTSTPEKSDSKDLDCFDFTEDEYLKLPPQVLNRRKRLPPVKVFELEDIDKIEEQRKFDEETERIAREREEDNKKLQAELENLLNTTTPATLPEIPTTHKVHENFPERRAEKDPEKMMSKEDDIKDRTLPPKERKKRIFKYRNRNRHPDSDAKAANTDVDEKDNSCNSSRQQSVSCEEKIIVNQMEDTIELNDQKDQSLQDKDPTAHDLQIEIAETLINFPLLSPKIDGNEQPHANAVEQKVLPKSKESTKKSRSIKKLPTVIENSSKPVTKGGRRKISSKETQLTHEEMKMSNELLVHDNKSNSMLSAPPMDTRASPDHLVDKTNDSSPAISNTQRDNPTNPSQSNSSVLVAPSFGLTDTVGVTPFDNNIPSIHQTYVTSSTQTIDMAPLTTTVASTSNVRDFRRIRLIRKEFEKIDNNAPIQSIDEVTTAKPHPLKQTVILTPTEGSSLIARIPKKRKSQMDDDIPAFVIERPKDIEEDSSDTSSQKTLTKKEPKSFIVTKTIKKQITGELPKANVPAIAGGVIVQKSIEANDKNDVIDASQHDGNAAQITANQSSIVNMTPMVNIQNTGASESSIGSPVIKGGHIIIHNS